VRNGNNVRVVSRTLSARFGWRVHGCVKNGLYMGQDLSYSGLDQRSRLPSFATKVELDDLRWLITVSSTFKEVDFDGSLLPLFIA